MSKTLAKEIVYVREDLNWSLFVGVIVEPKDDSSSLRIVLGKKWYRKDCRSTPGNPRFRKTCSSPIRGVGWLGADDLARSLLLGTTWSTCDANIRRWNVKLGVAGFGARTLPKRSCSEAGLR